MTYPKKLSDIIPSAVPGLPKPTVRTSDPSSTWAGGDVPIPYRVAADPALPWLSKMVYGLLNRFRGISHGAEPYPSLLYIATSLGIEERGARWAVAKLKHRGWIQVKRRGRSHTNAYVLSDVVPEAALPDVLETERAVYSLRLERQKRDGHNPDDRHERDARTTEVVSTRGTNTPYGVLLSHRLSPKEEVKAILSVRNTRRQRREGAINLWKELVAKCDDPLELSELLQCVHMQRTRADLVTKKYPMDRIKRVCSNVAADIRKPAGWIVDALMKGYKLPDRQGEA